MKKIYFVILISLLFACSQEPQDSNANQLVDVKIGPTIEITYPKTNKGDVVDTYFDTSVSDPYRWLEDDMSAETGEWVKSQNKVTFNYLDKIPFRKKLKARLSELWNFEKSTKSF